MVISEKKLEKLEHSKVRMTATVPMADLRSVYDEMMAEYVKSVRIDGFRKGHVPVSVLERKFGDSLRLEAMSRVLEKAVDVALAEAEERVGEGKARFKVEVRRSDKSFPLGSYELAAKLGEEILNAQSSLRVDVHNPDFCINIDIRENGSTYVF